MNGDTPVTGFKGKHYTAYVPWQETFDYTSTNITESLEDPHGVHSNLCEPLQEVSSTFLHIDSTTCQRVVLVQTCDIIPWE